MTIFSGFWWFVLFQFIPDLPTDLSVDEPARYVPYIHVAVGVFIAYYTAALWVNRTHIYANLSKLDIKHTPLPWFGNRVVEVPQIDQLYVNKVVRRTKNGTSTGYQLRAKTRAGKDLRFLSGLKNPNQAVFMEEQLEKHLNIKNTRVRGEY